MLAPKAMHELADLPPCPSWQEMWERRSRVSLRKRNEPASMHETAEFVRGREGVVLLDHQN